MREASPVEGSGPGRDGVLGLLGAQEANIDACVRCGLCLEFCPTYVLTGLEEEGPRGRIAMAQGLLSGHLEVTPDLVAHEMSCLVCEACTSVCPAGVRMEELGVGLRPSLVVGRRHVRDRALGSALRSLGNRSRLVRATRLLGMVRRLRLDRLARLTGLARALGVDPELLPEVPRAFVDPNGGGWRPVDREPVGRAVLFAGCVMSTLLAPLDVATGELLAAAGYEVEVVKGQTCCGALAAHHGDHRGAEGMAQRNLAALGGAQDDRPIVLNSAGCGAFLKGYPVHFGLEMSRLAERVVDLSEVLETAELDFSGPGVEGPVAYHDACHLRLAQGIVDPPRHLLERATGSKLAELAEPDLCCGSAGVYNLTHPEAAEALLQRKVEAVVASGAATVVTANPGCLLQLRLGLRRAGVNLPVVHLVEVLRAACPTPVERFGPGAAGGWIGRLGPS